MILFLLLFILFTLSFPIHAQEYIPYKNNPVLTKESTHIGAVQPFVLKEQNTFTLWYADMNPTYRIFQAKSANGIDWYEKADTHVTDRQNASDPFIFLENNQYTLYFASSNYGKISIWESTSSDGHTFQKGSEKEILIADSSWEGTNLSCPSVVKDNDIYYLFYAGSASGSWGIGLATSQDGSSWKKCENNPFIIPGASAHIVQYNNIFYLFFQSPNGLEVQQANSLNGCQTVWTDRHLISSELRDPSPIVVGDRLWLYGTLPTQNGYHIGLAANREISSPEYPIVLVPGMFSSWNKDAILHNTSVPYESWKINSYVHEYDGIINTLKNIGKVEGKDFYVFPYDWRKSVSSTVDNLGGYIEQTLWKDRPYLPIHLIGHSLGGVIAHSYIKNNIDKPVKSIATAGSPHLGAVQTYKPLAGGEIERSNTFMWLAEKLILLLNKSGLEHDKQTIARMLPVLKDLLPSFSFLKNENGQYIESYLTNGAAYTYLDNTSIKQLYLGGEGYDTLAGYTLSQRSDLDKLLDIYPDGHPITNWKEQGDGTVLLKSSLNQITPAPLATHGEVISKKDNIKTLLSFLGIQIHDEDIVEGKVTNIFPAIFIFIQSPAAIEIEHNGQLTKENEGMIWLQNTENGIYTLNVIGAQEGEYTVSIWLIGEQEDKWVQYTKNTTPNQKSMFTITFNSQTGGTVSEYISPTPTPTATPTPSPIPTKIPYPTPKPTAISHHRPKPIKQPIFILVIKNSIIKVFKFFIPGHRR